MPLLEGGGCVGKHVPQVQREQPLLHNAQSNGTRPWVGLAAWQTLSGKQLRLQGLQPGIKTLIVLTLDNVNGSALHNGHTEWQNEEL